MTESIYDGLVRVQAVTVSAMETLHHLELRARGFPMYPAICRYPGHPIITIIFFKTSSSETWLIWILIWIPTGKSHPILKLCITSHVYLIQKKNKINFEQFSVTSHLFYKIFAAPLIS